MNHLSDDFVNNIRIRLEEEKKTLTARIDELTKQDPFSDPERVNDNAANDAEANEESSHDRFSAMITELHDKISAIDEALGEIAEKTYGTCKSCGSPIPEDRLIILPTAVLCTDCESKKGNL